MDTNRLAKFLGMMGSQHDGEVLNAARMAEKIRREANKSWASLLSGDSETLRQQLSVAEWRVVAAEEIARDLAGRVTRLELELQTRRDPSPPPTPQPARKYSSLNGISGAKSLSLCTVYMLGFIGFCVISAFCF